MQGLEVNRARNLCPTNVLSFYHNLQTLYVEHKYSANHIWNCDESGAQAGRNGGGTLVFARRGSKAVHSIIPSEREWLSVLTCVNAAEHYIPHFFHFQRKAHAKELHSKLCDKLYHGNAGESMDDRSII
jgi:hypothetical protein